MAGSFRLSCGALPPAPQTARDVGPADGGWAVVGRPLRLPLPGAARYASSWLWVSGQRSLPPGWLCLDSEPSETWLERASFQRTPFCLGRIKGAQQHWGWCSLHPGKEHRLFLMSCKSPEAALHPGGIWGLVEPGRRIGTSEWAVLLIVLGVTCSLPEGRLLLPAHLCVRRRTKAAWVVSTH